MLTQSEISHALNWSWVGLELLGWIHTLMICTWTSGSVVYGGASSFLHLTPVTLEIFILRLIASIAAGFNLNPDAQSIQTKVNLVNFGLLSIIVGISCNVAHAVYTLITDVSTWYLIVLVIMLGFIICIEVIIFVYLIKLKRHLGIFAQVLMKRK